MTELTSDDYIEILSGGRRGTQFSKNYYIVTRKEKEKKTQKQILLNEGVGLPLNMNDEYEGKK